MEACHGFTWLLMGSLIPRGRPRRQTPTRPFPVHARAAAAMACGWLLAAAPGPASADGRTPADAFGEAVAECALAAPIVAGRPPGAMRATLESLFAADGCVRRLAAAQGVTPQQGPVGGGCHGRAEALAYAEAGRIEPGLRAALHRRACVEGASPRDWIGLRGRSPG